MSLDAPDEFHVAADFRERGDDVGLLGPARGERGATLEFALDGRPPTRSRRVRPRISASATTCARRFDSPGRKRRPGRSPRPRLRALLGGETWASSEAASGPGRRALRRLPRGFFGGFGGRLGRVRRGVAATPSSAPRRRRRSAPHSSKAPLWPRPRRRRWRATTISSSSFTPSSISLTGLFALALLPPRSDLDIGGKTARQLHELGRRTRVQAFVEADHNFALEHFVSLRIVPRHFSELTRRSWRPARHGSSPPPSPRDPRRCGCVQVSTQISAPGRSASASAARSTLSAADFARTRRARPRH